MEGVSRSLLQAANQSGDTTGESGIRLRAWPALRGLLLLRWIPRAHDADERLRY